MYPPYHGLLASTPKEYNIPMSINTSWYTTLGTPEGSNTSPTTSLFRQSFYEGEPGYLYWFVMHRSPIVDLPEHFQILVTQETPNYTPDPSLRQWTSLLRANNLDLGSINTYELGFEGTGRNAAIGKFVLGTGPFREVINSHSYLQTEVEPLPYDMFHDGPSVVSGGEGFILFGGSCILGQEGSFNNNKYRPENMDERYLTSLNPNRITMGHKTTTKGENFTPNVAAYGRETGYFAEITIAVTN